MFSTPTSPKGRIAGIILVMACATAIAFPVFAQSVSSAALTDHSLQPAISEQAVGSEVALKYSYLFAPPARWMDTVRWKYNPAGAPARP